MFTGDLTDGGSEVDYTLLADTPSPLTKPIFVIPGNREGREAFGEQTAAHRGGVLRILSGHTHRPFQAVWHGCLCAIGCSPAFNQELRLEPDRPEPVIVHEPFRYLIHKVDSAEDVTIHYRYVEV